MTVPGSADDQPLDFSSPADQSPSHPTCSSCKAEISDQYWSAGPAILCASCRDAVERGQSVSTDVTARTGRFTRALLFGLGGMLLGATVWYAVAKLADIEAGLIAILLGYLVGKGVFAGSGNRGGRRYQVLAIILTYLGIGVAYAPLAVEEFQKAARAEADSARAAARTDSTSPRPIAELSGAELAAETHRLDSVLASAEAPVAPKERPGLLGILAVLGIALAGILTLPVLLTIGGLPGSLISLLIYGFAIMEAWKLNRAAKLELTGPFRVGGAAPA
jgi:hypothetical protein